MTARLDAVDQIARPRWDSGGMPVASAAATSAADVETIPDSSAGGLSVVEAAKRLAAVGPNSARTHRVNGWTVLARQLRSALLVLLVVTATISFFLGDHTDAVIIGLILSASVTLGFANEYRAERAAQALHSEIRHTVAVIRDGAPVEVDVFDLVPGDVVRLQLGAVVPADLRLIDVNGLACDEAVLTGESSPVDKTADQVAPGTVLADLVSCALMGTVVRSGAGTGLVVTTGSRTEFGRMTAGLGEHPRRRPRFRWDCAASPSCSWKSPWC